MKAILVFNLPEDESELESAKEGWQYKLALNLIYEKIRAMRKYGGNSTKINDILLDLMEFLWDRVPPGTFD